MDRLSGGVGMVTRGCLVTNDSIFSGPHDRRKVRDWVYEELRAAIIDLRLRPGEPLREAAIADGLGVSKTPVREVFGRLEQEGLVDTTSFKGAVVSSYSRRDFVEIYEIRELLEGACARKAATSARAQDLLMLETNLAASVGARNGGDLEALVRLLDSFDAIIYRQVDNRRMQAMVDNMLAHLTRIGRLTEAIPGRIEASVDEHDAVVKAIARGEADAAESMMRLHIRSVMADQLDALDTNAVEVLDQVGEALS